MLPLGGIFVDVAGALRIEGMDRAEVVIMAVRIRALPPSATAYQVVSCVLIGNPYLKVGMRRKHCSGISQKSGSHFGRTSQPRHRAKVPVLRRCLARVF
jgi:hypothetical protein